MVRRPVAVVAAIVLLVEAVGIVVINGIMARFVEAQSMSLDGLDPDAMAAGTWGMGIGSGLFLALCGALLLLMGIRDRAPGRFTRILLIGCAVVHGVLGALTVGLVGWPAFAWMMLVLGLLVLSLIAYGGDDAPEQEAAPKEAAPA
ncbi:hypothetical protein J7E88_20975 [Streptomyces sp. ISL-10]|uniref:hypothetical protein n=1 Tax=Streptomyces sp. ISL-10 TaxID=2819172 RepID=UPI001BE78B48|nr:hypothetical protein [Streptomyces sp. ISL-10]MBT2367712.1 hypothetical protein [Streptomyces sp. ISL-10]